MKLRQLLCTLFFCFPTLLFAQDPEFSIPSSAPAQFNPALLGLHSVSSVRLTYRNQWAALSTTFNTSYLGGHIYLPKLNGTVGLNVLHDNGTDIIKTTVIGLSYGQHVRVGPKLVFKPAFGVSYRRRSIDYSKLTVGAILDPRYGNINPLTVDGTNASGIMDMTLGTIWYVKGFVIGGAVHHLAEPYQPSLGEDGDYLASRSTGEIGYTMYLGKQKTSQLQIAIVQHGQGERGISTTWLAANIKGVIIGVGNRGEGQFATLLGYRKDIFEVMYGYGVTRTNSTNAKAGNHEITLKYNFREDVERHENFKEVRSVLF
jgi:type IX secretion system PorP/SprF family membrane protein